MLEYTFTIAAVGESDGAVYPLVNISQAAEILGYTKRYTRQLADEGKLIGMKVGSIWLVHPKLIRSIPPQSDSLPAP